MSDNTTPETPKFPSGPFWLLKDWATGQYRAQIHCDGPHLEVYAYKPNADDKAFNVEQVSDEAVCKIVQERQTQAKCGAVVIGMDGTRTYYDGDEVATSEGTVLF